MTKIPLPPLPRPDKVYSNRLSNKSDATYWYSPETLRARDQEIVRAVLEAAAKWFGSEGHLLPTWDVDNAIRALEFTWKE